MRIVVPKISVYSTSTSISTVELNIAADRDKIPDSHDGWNRPEADVAQLPNQRLNGSIHSGRSPASYSLRT